MILDAGTLALAPAVELLIGESEKLDLPGRLKTHNQPVAHLSATSGSCTRTGVSSTCT